MRPGKQLIKILCCFLTLSAPFAVKAYAMDFDAETAYQSVFVVYSGNHIGSGFAVGPNAVVTNAHVIENADNIQLSAYEGKRYQADIYLIDQAFDIAVLSVGSASFTPLETGDSDALKAGDEIYAIGAPKSMGYTLTKGIVSNKERRIGAYNYIQIDAAINSGNSGGPLLNHAGQVVGVNSMKVSDAEGIGLAIPISSVISFIESSGTEVSEKNQIEIELPFGEKTPDSGRESASASDEFSEGKIYNKLTIVLAVSLGISLLLNIILIIMLVYHKNKNRDYFPDKCERTDFDIDILE